MKLTTERKPGSIVEFHIVAEDEEFQKAVDSAISRQARNVQIPGFRKGKAPRSMVERFYGGREVFQQDAAESLMDKYYQEALQTEDLRVVGDPEVTDLSFDPTLTFTVAVAIYPEVKLGDYKAARVDPIDAAVTDEDVEEVITRLQRQQGEWKDLEASRKPTEGDQVTIDYTVLDGDKEFQAPVEDAVWVLGETNLLQQLRDRIEDMEAGQTEEFDMLFEEDDESADPTIRGKQLHYTVTLKGVKERELPALDEAFAMAANGAATMDELREQVRSDIHQGKSGDARNEYLNALIEKIAEDSEIDIPAVMIDEEVEHQLSHRKEDLQKQGVNWDQMLAMSNMSEDDVKADTRPEAQRRLRNTMILQEIARLEEVKIEDKDLDDEINRIVGPDLNPDENDAEAVERARRMREVYNSDYFRNVLSNDLFERRLTDRIIEFASDGQGAVLNAWVAPEVDETASTSAETQSDGEVAQDVEDTKIEAETGTTASEAVADAQADQDTEPTIDQGASDESQNDAETTDATAGYEDEQVDDGTATKRSSKLPQDGEGTDWIPGDGTTDVKDGFTIKGNANSKIYHPEESSNYSSTIAEILFATPEVAEAHGYRLPKALQNAGESVGDAAAKLGDDE